MISTTAYKVPFTPEALRMEVSLGGVFYIFKTYWNVPMGCWILDIYDDVELPMVRGIPLVTGGDLVEQFEYLGFGGMLLIWSTEGPWHALPSFTSLGENTNVYFVPVTPD
jgi:hypothetical protein